MGRDGGHRPQVGRLPIRNEKTYKEGAVATVTVYDRRGRRLGTLYLGQMPEAYQTTLSEELTRLVAELLAEWDGCWPHLVYITEAGYHPTEYFDNVLSQREHPRHVGQLLEWTRIVDFYHATEYLAKHHRELRLTEKEEETYRKAYQYLNNPKAYMDYRTYRGLGLPIGSGITEAACKTVFTQRFKESGMSWGLEGGGVILTLRLAMMSQVWETVYSQSLATRPQSTCVTKITNSNQRYAKAA